MAIILVGDTIEDVERQLKALIGGDPLDPTLVPKPKHPSPAISHPAPSATEEKDLGAKLKDFKRRLSRTSEQAWKLVVSAANLPAGTEFTLGDLAKAMHENQRKVRSMHRLFERPAKRLNLVIFNRQNGRSRPPRFVMPPDVRRAVLSTP